MRLCRHSWEKKELLASSELTPEALETAKTGLETLIALLKEDKPAVFRNPATESRSILQLRANCCQRTKVVKVEAKSVVRRAEGPRRNRL